MFRQYPIGQPANNDQAYRAAIRRIRSDANYQPNITNDELIDLVVDEQGNARHRPRRSALAIMPSNITALDQDNHVIGAVFDIKIALKSSTEDDYYPVWHIDDSAVLFVSQAGQISVHARNNAENNNFAQPVNHLTADDFLGQASLHRDIDDLQQAVMPGEDNSYKLK